MPSVEKIEAAIRNAQTNVRYADLVKLCIHYFGTPRQQGTSHAVFSTPWEGLPFVNIQSKNGKGKPYQVKQVIAAIDKIQEENQ